MPIFGPKCQFWAKFGRFWAQNPIFGGQGVKILVRSRLLRERVLGKETAIYKDEESLCSIVSRLLLWHWLSVENIDRKTRTAVRMIITKAKVLSVLCYFINFLRGNVCLIDTSSDKGSCTYNVITLGGSERPLPPSVREC